MSKKTAVTSFLMICAVALVAAPAFGQGVAFQASSLPVQVRGEGLTETIGAVVLQATGSGTVPSGSSITIVYSGAIASPSAFTAQAGLSCSIGATPCTNFTVSATGSQYTVQVNTSTSFVAGNYIEVSQIRMNINALGSATSTVTATLSGTSATPVTNPITFTQSQVVVASIVNPSVKGSVGSTVPALQTCNIAAANTFTVTFTENYPAALTSTVDEGNFTGAIYTITNGSQVNVVVSSVPSGLSVQAQTYTAKVNGTTVGGTTALGAAVSGALTLNLAGGTAAFQTSSGGALTYTFFVTGDSTAAIESFTVTFGIGIANSAGTGFKASSLPSLGTVVSATAAVSLAPSSGVVSFATNNEGGGTVANISDCVTNMLFPFVTNQNGYDTSFSIANTTSDDLAFGAGAGATAQSGSCTMTLWPTTDTTLTSSSPLGSTVQYTTPTIPAGSVYAFSIGGNGTPLAGQTGYIITVCRFLNAHGFAFLTNGFAQAAGPQLSHGYLGLVLPNPVAGRTAAGGESAVQ